jgi:hypothetical protein
MKFIFICIALPYLISSCCVEGKMEATRKALSEIKQQQETENSRITGVSAIAGHKKTEGKIDSVIDNRIFRKVSQYLTGMSVSRNNVMLIDTLLTTRKEFRKKYKSLVLPLLDSLKSHNNSYADRVKLYMMIEDGLNIANYQLFDLAAFFASGKYEIPADKVALATESFSPIIDSVVGFSKRHNIKGTASLVILGFADGTGFSNEGPLFDTLTALIGSRDVSKEQLNKKLSELRAQELIKHLAQVFINKATAPGNVPKIDVEYIGQGKGEAYPFTSISDYTVDDPRRRIVLCYWIVLPD